MGLEPLHVRQSAERACGDRHDRRKRIITNGYCTRNEVRFTSFTLRHRDLHFSFANTRVSRFHHHHSCHTWKPHHLAPLIELPQVGADYGAPRHVSPEDPSRMQRKKSPAPPMDNDMLDCGLTSIDRSTLRDRSTDPKFCWDVEKQGRQPSHLGGFSVVQMTSAGNGDIRTSDMTNPAAHHPICAAASASSRAQTRMVREHGWAATESGQYSANHHGGKPWCAQIHCAKCSLVMVYQP